MEIWTAPTDDAAVEGRLAVYPPGQRTPTRSTSPPDRSGRASRPRCLLPRRVDTSMRTRRSASARYIAMVGDAELDEGNIWEAIADPPPRACNVMWVVDFNRQSLDRVVPGVRLEQWTGHFQSAGWHVIELKYGKKLRRAFAMPGGDALRSWIDEMSNEQYQSLFGLAPTEVRQRFLENAPEAVHQFFSDMDDHQMADLVKDLGGHDLESLADAFAPATKRRSTERCLRLHNQGIPADCGQPRNHSAL